MEGKLSEKVDEPNEIAKPREAQSAPEAVQRGSVISDTSKQANWRETQQQHMLEQDESATDLF
jgi:phage tail tape-measure protein